MQHTLEVWSGASSDARSGFVPHTPKPPNTSPFVALNRPHPTHTPISPTHTTRPPPHPVSAMYVSLSMRRPRLLHASAQLSTRLHISRWQWLWCHGGGASGWLWQMRVPPPAIQHKSGHPTPCPPNPPCLHPLLPPPTPTCRCCPAVCRPGRTPRRAPAPAAAPRARAACRCAGRSGSSAGRPCRRLMPRRTKKRCCCWCWCCCWCSWCC